VLASIFELLITILAVPLVWLAWDRYVSAYNARLYWPFGPANDVALMLILAVAVIWALMGVYDPETYGWKFLR